jgi:hypothetical protein
MLSVSGELDPKAGGPYVPTTRSGEGEIVVAEDVAGSHRRSLYLQQRRTQVAGLLDTFDAPSIVTNCTFRTPTTVPLQSLALLNSDFVRRRSQAFARRVLQEPADKRIGKAFLLARSVPPGSAESQAAERFLQEQLGEYGADSASEEKAWTDFCQSLLASNSFLYVR